MSRVDQLMGNLLLIIIVLFGVVGCINQVNSLPQSYEITITNLSEPYSIREVQTHVQNNCDGADQGNKIRRDIADQQSISFDDQVGGKVDFSGEIPETLKIQVAAHIIREVKKQYSGIENRGVELTLTTPPGYIRKHTIIWEVTYVDGSVKVSVPFWNPNFRKILSVQVADRSSVDEKCNGSDIIPTSQAPTSSRIEPTTVSTSGSFVRSQSFTNSDLDKLLGVGNWTCIHGHPNGITIRNIPANFSVQSPLISVDKQNIRYNFGDAVPGGGLATGWLEGNLPDNQCSTIRKFITQAKIDEVLGKGNWSCLNEWPNGLLVKNVPQGFTIVYPLASVDKLEIRYDFSQSVPAGGPATAWLQSDLSRDQCP